MLYSSEAKDPNATAGYELDWSPHLGEETIASSLWIVPSGIVMTASGPTMPATYTTIGLTGGTAGRSYRLTNRVNFTGGGSEDWVLDIRVEEVSSLPNPAPPYATLSEAQEYSPSARDLPAIKAQDVLRDASDEVQAAAKRPPDVQDLLSASMDATQTLIPVSDSALFPDSGVVVIDNELIYYFGKQPGALLGQARGYLATAPQSHSSAAVVKELSYQLKARRAELRVFDYLVNTDGYISSEGISGISSNYVDLDKIRAIIRGIMHEFVSEEQEEDDVAYIGYRPT